MEQTEWLARCAQRYRLCGGLNAEQAKQAALACLEGISSAEGGDYADDPEGAADEDMRYWEDDDLEGA